MVWNVQLRTKTLPLTIFKSPFLFFYNHTVIFVDVHILVQVIRFKDGDLEAKVG